ncbi:MAG: TPM domain-containing protein [Thermoplasmata archaeon]|nr:TPM domain-containing protein [Thermoplasmata archaeon]
MASPERVKPRSAVLPGSLLVVLLLAALPASAQELPTLFLYTNDLTEPRVLLQDEIEALDSLCFEVDRLTTAEIAILIVNTTQPLGLDFYAVDVFEANGIGKAGMDNGVLLLVSVDEAGWRIEVGFGLEGVLNDAKVGRIGRDLLAPGLQVGDYYGGIYDATLALGQEIVDLYDPDLPGDPPVPDLLIFDWEYLVITLVIAIVVAGLTKGGLIPGIGIRWRRGGFGGGRSGGGGARGRL